MSRKIIKYDCSHSEKKVHLTQTVANAFTWDLHWVCVLYIRIYIPTFIENGFFLLFFFFIFFQCRIPNDDNLTADEHKCSGAAALSVQTTDYRCALRSKRDEKKKKPNRRPGDLV